MRGVRHRLRVRPAVTAVIEIVLRGVSDKHSEYNVQHPAKPENQETASAAREGLGSKLELSDFRCRGVLYCRPGEDAGRSPPGGSPGQIWPLDQARGHEGVAPVLGHRSRAASAQMCVRQGPR